MNSHEHYEELCALAATGQASPPELLVLEAHLKGCPSCCALSDDLIQLSSQGLAPLAAGRSRSQVPSGMTQRFVARARSEGFDVNPSVLSSTAKHSFRVNAPALSAAAAAILLVAVFALRYASFKFPSTAATGRVRVQTQDALAASSIPLATVLSKNDEAAQLADARNKISTLDATIRAQRDELQALTLAKGALSSQLAEAENQKAGLQSGKIELEARLSQVQTELEKSRADKTASEVALAFQQNELRELRKKVDDQAEQLRQQDELTARGSDVRDLVVARNLHIIDVHDRDSDGKSQRAFGRIFYTEGKSLIFYAYDLADAQKVNAKVSFCVWGERLGADKPIKSLGILHNDDVNDGRWVLTFGDPQVLAQIDSVFVTVESSGKAVREPGGRRILFAFLGEKPNHP